MTADRRTFLLTSFATALTLGGGRAFAQQPTYPAGMTDAQLNALLDKAVDELWAKQQANEARWGIGEWSVDLEQGWIAFGTRDSGRVRADAQVIGTYVAAQRSWMWGWDHPSIPTPRRAHAQLVKQFADTQRLEAMKQRIMENVTEEDAWAFTALAAHLAGAAGGYRGPSGGTYIFMTHGLLHAA